MPVDLPVIVRQAARRAPGGRGQRRLYFGAELLEALKGTAGPGSGLGQPLEIGVSLAHVGRHPGRVNPVEPQWRCNCRSKPPSRGVLGHLRVLLRR